MMNLDNYLGKSQFVTGLGDIYPLKVLEYQDFEYLGYKYLKYSKTGLVNLRKMQPDQTVYNYLVDTALEDSEFILSNVDKIDFNNPTIILQSFFIDEIIKLLNLTTKKQFTFDEERREFVHLGENGEIENVLNEENFDAFQQVVCNQNLIFEPLTSPDIRGQEHIETMYRVMSKKNPPSDLEAMISYLSVVMGIVDVSVIENFTYYRLRADFESAVRNNQSFLVAMCISQGAKADPIDFSQPLSLHENPHEGLMTRATITDADKALLEAQGKM